MAAQLPESEAAVFKLASLFAAMEGADQSSVKENLTLACVAMKVAVNLATCHHTMLHRFALARQRPSGSTGAGINQARFDAGQALLAQFASRPVDLPVANRGYLLGRELIDGAGAPTQAAVALLAEAKAALAAIHQTAEQENTGQAALLRPARAAPSRFAARPASVAPPPDAPPVAPPVNAAPAAAQAVVPPGGRGVCHARQPTIAASNRIQEMAANRARLAAERARCAAADVQKPTLQPSMQKRPQPKAMRAVPTDIRQQAAAQREVRAQRKLSEGALSERVALEAARKAEKDGRLRAAQAAKNAQDARLAAAMKEAQEQRQRHLRDSAATRDAIAAMKLKAAEQQQQQQQQRSDELSQRHERLIHDHEDLLQRHDEKCEEAAASAAEHAALLEQMQQMRTAHTHELAALHREMGSRLTSLQVKLTDAMSQAEAATSAKEEAVAKLAQRCDGSDWEGDEPFRESSLVPSHVSQSGDTTSHYVCGALLGSGGFGSVRLAYKISAEDHAKLYGLCRNRETKIKCIKEKSEQVAVKSLDDENVTEEERCEMLQHEKEINHLLIERSAAQGVELSIVRLLGAYDTDFVLVFELLRGGDLGHMVRGSRAATAHATTAHATTAHATTTYARTYLRV